MKKLISIVTPCYNESANVEELYKRVKNSVKALRNYDFEIIFIDNASQDDSVSKIKKLASEDKSVKLIVNTRNFGHIRSPYYGILQSKGVATIYLASDLQDPPEIIPEFLKHWEAGYKLVMAVKPYSQGSRFITSIRKKYYRILDDISEISVSKDSTGFGLYDQDVLDHLRKIDDPYPFLRGLICELGYEVKTIEFNQPQRLRGVTKNNFYSLYDIAMLGIVSHSKVPIRLAGFLGVFLGVGSLIVAVAYAVLKLVFWYNFPLGMAPIVIGVFFLLGLQLIFLSVLGEYISSIHTYVQKRPLVVEKERVNFDSEQ